MATLTAEVAAARGLNKYACHDLPMKNGRWRVALLAGGPSDIARDVRTWLAETRNVYVKYHLEANRTREWQKPIPEDVDFCILLKDFMGHPDFHRIKDACKRSRTPYVLTQRKKSTMSTALLIRGVQAGVPIPVEVSSMAFFHDPEPTRVDLRVVGETPPETASTPEIRAESPVANQDTPKPDLLPTVNLVVQQAALPAELPAKRPGIPSPQLAAVAAALQALCAQDGVTVLVSPLEMTINSYVERR